MQILSEFIFGDMSVCFLIEPVSSQVAIEIFPTALQGNLATRRSYALDIPEATEPASLARIIDPLVQIKIAGDPAPGMFASGHTMRQSVSNSRFRYDRQLASDEGGRVEIRTILRSTERLVLVHTISWREGDKALQISTCITNESSEAIQIEMLSSFSISGITSFAPDDAPERLRVHRIRSGWSAEGRLESRMIEDLHLERSWSGVGAFSERFGQVGSMPVRKWFPFVAIEDIKAGVLWGAQLAWAGSWQMEIFRQHDDVCISGGLADREFGHWLKTLMPGETFNVPAAAISCVQGTLDELCDRLTDLQHRSADAHPAVEADLPIVFNEWCTTWGDPQHDKIVAIADRLEGTDTRYLVIDAGWFKREGGHWQLDHGDWNCNATLFPKGLEATARAIRSRGLIPGLWFEIETCGATSNAFSLVDHLLSKDGKPLTSNQRRFWNLNDPWVIDYLTKKVIDCLESCGFEYLKVDYNETIGIGCDHPDSLGEGLRLQTLGTYRFFERIRKQLPNLVIENCASGGHRLEPSMLARSAMSSFSDAHESMEIPIIAAGLHRLLLPRQSQIWAVLHAKDSDQRLIYSLVSTFLGRMCLSGEIVDISSSQWQLVQSAMRLYRLAAPIIKHGVSRHFGIVSKTWRHPSGWQGVRRISKNGSAILIILHAFSNSPKSFAIPLPKGEWKISDQLSTMGIAIADGRLEVTNEHDFSASAVILSI